MQKSKKKEFYQWHTHTRTRMHILVYSTFFLIETIIKKN